MLQSIVQGAITAAGESQRSAHAAAAALSSGAHGARWATGQPMAAPAGIVMGKLQDKSVAIQNPAPVPGGFRTSRGGTPNLPNLIRRKAPSRKDYAREFKAAVRCVVQIDRAVRRAELSGLLCRSPLVQQRCARVAVHCTHQGFFHLCLNPRYADIVPVHQAWRSYVQTVLSSATVNAAAASSGRIDCAPGHSATPPSPQQALPGRAAHSSAGDATAAAAAVQRAALEMDLHGAQLRVVRSREAHVVGACGLVARVTSRTLCLVDPSDRCHGENAL
jgi:hypothetical protein